MNYAKSRSEIIFQVLAVVFLMMLSVSAIYPFVNSFALAFNQGHDSLRGGIYLWPRVPTLENFQAVLSNNDILNGAYISVFKTVIGALAHVMVCAACAYALSKRILPGYGIIVTFLFIPSLFGGGIIPLFILLRNLHLTNSIWIYIFPSLFSFFNVQIIRTFFINNLPAEIEEAAIIDGCGYVRIFLRIILPLSMPVLATIILYAAVGQWNDWFTGYFFISKKSLRPLQTILVTFLKENETNNVFSRLGVQSSVQQQSFTSESLKMAVLVVVVLPILCVYPFVQKYFIKGVMIGSVKG